MKIFILRWIWLISSLGVSFWLTRSITIQGWFAVIAFISIGWLIYTVYVKREFKWSLLSYILTPILVWSSALTIIIFMRQGFQEWLIIGIAFMLSWFWSSTLQKQEDFQSQGIFRGNLLGYINSFVIFFTASSIFAAVVFVSMPQWIGVLIVLVLSFILHLQVMRASHIPLQKGWLHSLIASILITEIFLSLLYWPSSFLVNGVIVTVAFYVLTGVSRCIITSVLSKKLMTRYFAWGSLIVFTILVTADWQ